MTVLPVMKLVLPKDLKDQKPGELKAELLRNVKPHGQLHHLAADAYHALRAKALADGLPHFRPTSAGDTYRTLALQKQGFLQRYQLEPIQGATTRTWEGKKWYLKKGMAPMAAPGTSNHNLGLAVDVAEASGERLKWMLNNCASFGWSWEVESEPWHIRYVAGDGIPLKVLDWKASQS